jgi:thiamine biosynthesis lipoprotein
MQTLTLAVEAMATRFELVLCGDEARGLRAAGEAALEAIEESEALLSRFVRSAAVARLSRAAGGPPLKLLPELVELLALCLEAKQATGGAFDLLWRTGGELWLDRERCLARLEPAGSELDLGAVGKGYALDRAGEALRAGGVERALLHGGTSTLLALGPPPGQRAWRFALDLESGERREFELVDGAFSASSQRRQVVRDGGLHVQDPRGGPPPAAQALAAVRARDATRADLWSTAALLLADGPWPELASASGVERLM